MPTISMFYGILIRMFFRDIEKHHPHIHADYQGQVAVYSIPDGTLLAGGLPRISTNWSSHGLRFIKKICWLTGTWLSTVRHLSQSKDLINENYGTRGTSKLGSLHCGG